MVRVILLALTFLILFPASSFAAYEIYTYGSGDFVAQTFNALKILFGDGTIMSMIKMVLILMFLHIMLSIFYKVLTTATVSNYGEGIDPISNPVAGFMVIIRVGIIAAFTVVLFGSMRTDVNIIDRLEPGQTQTVSNVPFLNAVVASYSSLIGDKIGSALEEVLTPVDAPRVSSEGFLAGPRYLNDILEITAPGSPEAYGVVGYIPIKTTLTMWFERCIFPNFAYIPGEDSDQAKGLWFLRHGGYLFSPSGIFATSPYFRNHFIELPIEYTPTIPVDCENAPNQILVEWQNVFNNWLEKDGKKLVGEKIDSLSLLSLSDRIEKIYNRYFASKFNYTFAESMVQIATLNELKGAIMAFDAKWGEGSLQNSLTERTVSSGWVQGAKLFGKVVIYMRQLFEALIYGLSIFLPIAFVVAGYKAIVTFVKINFWLQLWVPGFVLINAFSDWQLDNLVSSFNFPDGGFSYSTLDEFKRQVNLMLGYYGAFMWSIPALAWGLLKGSDVAMGTVMSSLGASGRAQAELVGGQVGGMGNVSVGQQAYGSTRFMDSTMIGSKAGGVWQQAFGAHQDKLINQFGLTNFDRAVSGSLAAQLASGLATQNFIDQHGLPRLLSATEGNVFANYAQGEGAGRFLSKYGYDSLVDSKFIEFSAQLGHNMAEQELANRYFGGSVAASKYARSLIEALRSYGPVEALKEGYISERDLVDIAKYAIKAAAGNMDAQRGLETLLGKDFRTISSEINKYLSMSGYQEMATMKALSESLGFKGERGFMDFLGLLKSGNISFRADEQSANILNKMAKQAGLKNVDIKPGDVVNLAFDVTSGKATMIRSTGGGRSDRYDFNYNLTGWQKDKRSLATNETGSYTHVHHGEVRHYVGTGYDMPQYSDFFEAVVHNNATTFHKNYGGLMWSSRQAREAMVVAFARQLEQFGDLKALLNKAMQAGIKISPAGPVGKFLSAAGVDISAGGEIQSIDKFDVNKLLFELQKNAHELAGNTYLNSSQKSKAFVGQGHELVELFRKTAELSVPQRLVGGKGSMGSTPIIIDLPDQNM